MIDKWSEIVSIKYIPMLFKSSRKDEFGFNSDFTTVPKIIKNLRIKTDPVTVGTEKQYMSGLWARQMSTKARHIPLHQLPP